MRRFLKGSKRFFIISMLCAALAALADMISPQIIRAAIDNAIGGKPAEFPAWVMRGVDAMGGFAYLGEHLWIMALAVVVVAAVKVMSQYVFRVSNTKASETLVKTMRDTAFSHIDRRHHPALYLGYRHDEELCLRAADECFPHPCHADPEPDLHVFDGRSSDADRLYPDAVHHRLFAAFSHQVPPGLHGLRRERGQALDHGPGEPDGRARRARLWPFIPRCGKSSARS